MKVNLSLLDRSQLEHLCKHQSQLADFLIAASNTLRIRIEENGDVGDATRALLDEWATAMNRAIASHDHVTGLMVGEDG